jgi:hypothetical protein
MALLIVDEGEVECLSRMLNKSATGDMVLHLYSNDKTPADADTTASYTESTGTGYGAATLTGANWTISSVANVGTASYAQITFTMTSALTAYGYYVTNLAGTKLIWAERFTTPPYTLPAGGGTIKVTPNFTLNHA